MPFHFFRRLTQMKAILAFALSCAAGFAAMGQTSGTLPQCTFCDRAEAFMKLPPEERVRIWFKDMSRHTSATGLAVKDDEHLLISLGLDTVPELAKIVRSGGLNQQIDAVSLLCDMDRFVPMADLPAPEPFAPMGPYLGFDYYGPFIGQPYERYKGEINPYMLVDGRRIGPQGSEAVLWAATQTANKKLRTFARNCSGLISQDLQQLNTTALLAAWRKGIIAGHVYWINLENQFLPVADAILIQRSDESIPLLAKIVVEDKTQEVTLHAREILLRIDREKVRLRGSEAGLRAIAALNASARMRPLVKWRADTSVSMVEQSHRAFIAAIDDRTMKDTASLGDPPFGWLARAFADLYGEDTTYRKQTATGTITQVKPEFSEFIAYMTRVDPTFPGWECSTVTISAPYFDTPEVVRPCFKAQVDRLHKYWLQYRTEVSRTDSADVNALSRKKNHPRPDSQNQ